MSPYYAKPVDNMSAEQRRLYENVNHAIAQDALVEGMLNVPAWKNLGEYSDPRFAQENVYFVDAHGQNTSILCERGTFREASFFMTGVVWQLGCMPFLNTRDVMRPEPWAPQGAQHLILTLLGFPEGHRYKGAYENFHVMASLRVRRNGLRELRQFDVHGEESICLSLPFSTRPEHVMPHESIVALPSVLDPRGIVQSYAQRRGHVITNRNLLDVFLAEPTKEAGKYELDEASPEILRQGQVVRVELVFRIVPAGNDFTLRTDVKSVIVINTQIAENIAFAEIFEKQRERLNKRGAFSIGGSGPSGSIIASSSAAAHPGTDVHMKDAAQPIVFEGAPRFTEPGFSDKGKGKAVNRDAAIGQLPFESS